MSTTLAISMMTAKALEILAMPEDEFNRRNEMEMVAEIERLRARIAELEAEEEAPRWAQDLIENLRTTAIVAKREADQHISRLQVRIAELEGHAAITFGTLERPTSDEPSRFTCNIPPSAPPHDE